MLVLSRKQSERIRVGSDIVVAVVTSPRQVQLGIESQQMYWCSATSWIRTPPASRRPVRCR